MKEMYLKFENLDYLHEDIREELDRRLPSLSRFEDFNLNIVLPKNLQYEQKLIEEKIRKIAEKRTEILEFEYLLKRRQSFQNLFKGFILLIIFFAFAYYLNTFESRFLSLASETFTIAVWVAIWKPLDSFLFELPKLKLLYLNYRKVILAKISFKEEN